MSKIVHVMMGVAAGAAMTAAVEAMNAKNRRKLKKFCVSSGRKLAEKAEDMFG